MIYSSHHAVVTPFSTRCSSHRTHACGYTGHHTAPAHSPPLPLLLPPHRTALSPLYTASDSLTWVAYRLAVVLPARAYTRLPAHIRLPLFGCTRTPHAHSLRTTDTRLLQLPHVRTLTHTTHHHTRTPTHTRSLPRLRCRFRSPRPALPPHPRYALPPGALPLCYRLTLPLHLRSTFITPHHHYALPATHYAYRFYLTIRWRYALFHRTFTFVGYYVRLLFGGSLRYTRYRSAATGIFAVTLRLPGLRLVATFTAHTRLHPAGSLYCAFGLRLFIYLLLALPTLLLRYLPTASSPGDAWPRSMPVTPVVTTLIDIPPVRILRLPNFLRSLPTLPAVPTLTLLHTIYRRYTVTLILFDYERYTRSTYRTRPVPFHIPRPFGLRWYYYLTTFILARCGVTFVDYVVRVYHICRC